MFSTDVFHFLERSSTDLFVQELVFVCFAVIMDVLVALSTRVKSDLTVFMSARCKLLCALLALFECSDKTEDTGCISLNKRPQLLFAKLSP